ncbi:MAG: molybdate transport system substrate-binding protein, partial [Solirubrobacteraceae bacterium]|nr:molybdate transport system substrate-binding protein [Solirubrobacteraceae bacterium]
MLNPTLTRRVAAAVAAIGASVLAVGCGSASSSSSSGTTSSAPSATTAAGSKATVFAAASLSKVFPKIEPSATYPFGGSGALETQIEQGAPADVFAAASPKQPAQLLAKGLIGAPT